MESEGFTIILQVGSLFFPISNEDFLASLNDSGMSEFSVNAQYIERSNTMIVSEK
jgi:hypothetical protein